MPLTPPSAEPAPATPSGVGARWLSWWRAPQRAARLAYALWCVWAFVVWNVVFDRVLVLAGRRFVYEASVTASAGGGYLSAGVWMGEAVHRGILLASAAAALIVLVGIALIRVAVCRGRVQAVGPVGE